MPNSNISKATPWRSLVGSAGKSKYIHQSICRYISTGAGYMIVDELKIYFTKILFAFCLPNLSRGLSSKFASNILWKIYLHPKIYFIAIFFLPLSGSILYILQAIFCCQIYKIWWIYYSSDVRYFLLVVCQTEMRRLSAVCLHQTTILQSQSFFRLGWYRRSTCAFNWILTRRDGLLALPNMLWWVL